MRHCAYCAKIARISSHTRNERMTQYQYTGFKKIIVTRANSKRSEIRTINFSNPRDKTHPDRMVALFTQMLDLNKKLQDARLEQEKTMRSRQIEATDASIDKLVYDLYGLTAEEIAIVEGT